MKRSFNSPIKNNLNPHPNTNTSTNKQTTQQSTQINIKKLSFNSTYRYQRSLSQNQKTIVTKQQQQQHSTTNNQQYSSQSLKNSKMYNRLLQKTSKNSNTNKNKIFNNTKTDYQHNFVGRNYWNRVSNQKKEKNKSRHKRSQQCIFMRTCLCEKMRKSSESNFVTISGMQGRQLIQKQKNNYNNHNYNSSNNKLNKSDNSLKCEPDNNIKTLIKKNRRKYNLNNLKARIKQTPTSKLNKQSNYQSTDKKFNYKNNSFIQLTPWDQTQNRWLHRL